MTHKLELPLCQMILPLDLDSYLLGLEEHISGRCYRIVIIGSCASCCGFLLLADGLLGMTWHKDLGVVLMEFEWAHGEMVSLD